MTLPNLSAPTPIRPEHRTDEFSSGEPILDDWLRQRALKNERLRGSRTFVVCEHDRVVGYYSLATGALDRDVAPKALGRNMPNPIPVLLIGRLAVDQRFQGYGVGRALMKNAILRAYRVSDEAGVKAILVHAISEDAKRFYLKFGFVESPVESRTLCFALASLS